MISSRRGFLGLFVGAVTGGPSAVKAAAKANLVDAAANAAISTGLNHPSEAGIEADYSYEARGALDYLSGVSRCSEYEVRDQVRIDVDIRALKSVSPVRKEQMQEDRNAARNARYYIRELIRQKKLNFIPGMSESDIVRQLERLAG